MTASCKTVVKVPSFMDRGAAGSMGGWASIANQKLDQITRSWNTTFKFKQQKDLKRNVGAKKKTITGIRQTLIVNYVGPDWRSTHELAYPEQPV